MQELLSLYFLAFTSGVLTTLQPCIFPLMPTYLSYMTNGNQSSKQGVIGSIFLTIGILIIFLFLALLIKAGQIWIAIFLNSYTVEFNVLMAIILLILGLLMILKVDLTIFYRLPNLSRIHTSHKPENSIISSFYLGLSYTAIAAPCAAPIFLSLITLIIVLQPTVISLMILVYAIGAGSPFLLIGLIIPSIKFNLNMKFNQIAKWIKPISGFIIILMSLFLFNTYYFPYYPITINNIQFKGINEYLLFKLYLIILGIPFLILIIFVLYIYIKKILFEKKRIDLQTIE